MLLVVAATDSIAESLDHALRELDPTSFETVRVATPGAALAYLATKTADCALVDLSAPDAPGLEAIEVLSAEMPAMPLIVVAPDEDESLRTETSEAGATDLLSIEELSTHSLTRSVRRSILQKRSENSMAEAERIAGIGSWELDIASRRMRWSRELYRLFAFDDSDRPSYEALLERIHPGDREITVRSIRAAIADPSHSLSSTASCFPTAPRFGSGHVAG